MKNIENITPKIQKLLNLLNLSFYEVNNDEKYFVKPGSNKIISLKKFFRLLQKRDIPFFARLFYHNKSFEGEFWPCSKNAYYNNDYPESSYNFVKFSYNNSDHNILDKEQEFIYLCLKSLANEMF